MDQEEKKQITDFDEVFNPSLDDIVLIVVTEDNINGFSKLRNLPLSESIVAALNTKQAVLISGQNIKTINGSSLLGSGDLSISGGGGGSANLKIDYDYNIVGAKDGTNTNFSTTSNFITGTTRVYLNGQRLTPGPEYDYVEISSNQVSLFYTPVPSDRLIIEYETL
jgi:hypothetical protein